MHFQNKNMKLYRFLYAGSHKANKHQLGQTLI